jgi:hypothetical protein
MAAVLSVTEKADEVNAVAVDFAIEQAVLFSICKAVWLNTKFATCGKEAKATAETFVFSCQCKVKTAAAHCPSCKRGWCEELRRAQSHLMSDVINGTKAKAAKPSKKQPPASTDAPADAALLAIGAEEDDLISMVESPLKMKKLSTWSAMRAWIVDFLALAHKVSLPSRKGAMDDDDVEDEEEDGAADTPGDLADTADDKADDDSELSTADPKLVKTAATFCKENPFVTATMV